MQKTEKWQATRGPAQQYHSVIAAIRRAGRRVGDYFAPRSYCTRPLASTEPMRARARTREANTAAQQKASNRPVELAR
jgi:hypothetical protein